jgi:hypothetical protein
LDKPTFKQLSKFDSEVYVRLIRYLNQIYKIVPFCETPKEDVPYLILRHDIDVSLESALKMAKIEKKMGIRSTYFVQVSSYHYNSFEGKNVAIIRQISGLGHEIGLHYDVGQYKGYTFGAIEGLKTELHALESIVGKKVRSISSHAPTRPSSFLNISSYTNADDTRLRDIYVHDSRKLWTIKSLDILLNKPARRVQLLIHPYHWFPLVKPNSKLDEAFLQILWLLYRARNIVIRVVHSRESCEN